MSIAAVMNQSRDAKPDKATCHIGIVLMQVGAFPN